MTQVTLPARQSPLIVGGETAPPTPALRLGMRTAATLATGPRQLSLTLLNFRQALQRAWEES